MKKSHILGAVAAAALLPAAAMADDYKIVVLQSMTGAAAFIGAALTEGFIAQGARVAFVQRSDANAFADELGERHGNRPLFLERASQYNDLVMLCRKVDRHQRKDDERDREREKNKHIGCEH